MQNQVRKVQNLQVPENVLGNKLENKQIEIRILSTILANQK